VPRHVVLLTRDASLVVAVKALLDDEDRVSELESPQELPPVGELPVDAVVVDLPSASRQTSVERVRGRFSGPLVVLLGHGEDPEKARVTYRCSVLTRPFGMSQLWSLLVDSASEALTEVIPAVQRDPAMAPPPDPAPPPPRERSAAAPAPASGPVAREWPAPGPPPASGPPAPVPGRSERAGQPAPVERPGREGPLPGSPPAPVPRRPTRVSDQPELAPERQPRPAAAEAERPAPSVPPTAAERAEHAEAGEGATGSSASQAARREAADVRPQRAGEGGGRVPAWSWRLRRFQHAEPEAPDAGELTQPMPAVPPLQVGNGVAPTVDRPERAPQPPGPQAAQPRPPAQAPPPAAPRPTGQEVAPDPPETVAGRLAERLGADTVALLLDNNRGLLEVAGGVGLTAAERQLQVEYGHEVLLELFRVGVGLIEDTERVRPLIRGIPGSRSQSLVMVPLVHEGHGFGALVIGRSSPPGQPRPEFTEPEIEALMDFADDVAAPLRSTVLLRRLKGQLNSRDRT
jgi:GAF domain